MAGVTFLGSHKPSALSFLIAEGILPPEPSDHLFTWQIIRSDDNGGAEIEEELITTKHCVVWSRGSIIQRVFRFDAEQQPITQTLFAKFSQDLAERQSKSAQISHPGNTSEVKPILHENKPRVAEIKASKPPNETDSQQTRVTSLPGIATEDASSKILDHALVVILKTHLHVCFLSGPTHVVHLPFEVDITFPLVNGVLLQRKLSGSNLQPHNLVFPPVPIDLSDASCISSSKQLIGSHISYTSPNLLSSSTTKDTHLSLSNAFSSQFSKNSDSLLPRFYTLTDPLLELGIAVEEPKFEANDRLGNNSTPLALAQALDFREHLVYISAKDEFDAARSGPPTTPPFIISTTLKQLDGSLTVWLVNCSDNRFPYESRNQLYSTVNGQSSYPRSSYGPGVSNLLMSVVKRDLTNYMEAMGSVKLRSQHYKSTSHDGGLTSPEDQLASRLDSAFENPALPAKSSRRVSSLLARADLSSSHDKSTFSELASGHAAINGLRRGTSFGMYGTRLSLGNVGISVHGSSKSLSGIRSSFKAYSEDEQSFSDEFADNVSTADSASPNISGLHDVVRGLRKELIFTKIHCFSINGSSNGFLNPQTTKFTRPRVFTLQPPSRSFTCSSKEKTTYLCIHDTTSQELHLLHIEAHLKNESLNKGRSKSSRSRGKAFWHSATVLNTIRYHGVIDACKIKNGDCSRILLLRKVVDSVGELSVLAPWSIECKIKLPSTLTLRNPYQLNSNDFLPYKDGNDPGSTSSKRPTAFVKLQHEDNGRVDLLDDKGSRNRIEIQLKPHNPHVSNIISIGECVLPQSIENQESLLRGWWDVISWLQTNQDEAVHTEWTAIIVVLFSLAASFVHEQQSENSARQRKRKGGFLRSSSGAHTDLECWESMLTEESDSSNTPPWVQDIAWNWTIIYEGVPQKHLLIPSKVAGPSHSMALSTTNPFRKKSLDLIRYFSLSRGFLKSSAGMIAIGQRGYLPTALSKAPELRRTALAMILVALHLLREEYKLNIMLINVARELTPVLAQLGGWLGWESWSFGQTSYYSLEGINMQTWLFDNTVIMNAVLPTQPFEPPSILRFIESSYIENDMPRFMSLLDVANLGNRASLSMLSSNAAHRLLQELTPRTLVITSFLNSFAKSSAKTQIAEATAWRINNSTIETLPEGVAAVFRTAVSVCQSHPPSTWDNCVLITIGRDDVAALEQVDTVFNVPMKSLSVFPNEVARDVHTMCSSTLDLQTTDPYDVFVEEDRLAITRMIYKDDKRFDEAIKLVHPLRAPVVECTSEPDWSDTEFLEAQQELAKTIAIKTLAVSVGRGLVYYCARRPILTEKFPIHGFTLSCLMKPTNTTVTADRNLYTEEKVSWAFFHAGVEAGLSIPRNAKGIDPNWILFNKPQDMKNRHAGFLLALGLNGHLKSIAKWVAFKYLTPKHTMTSIGLILGLSASYIGTMDTLITRVLSVHVTRMLPVGAAPLNISPLTQTSGIMGIGLLYCSTQHRRMSEIMLSEVENMDFEDTSNPLDHLRDEGYRLAAGFALGYINLGRGKDLKGLQDMRIVERLLTLAIEAKKVSAVHILDKATAAATIAIALIFMKTEDATVARKVDVPDTTHQFDHVRPDIFLLRTTARHLIMWNDIKATTTWMKQQLPLPYRNKLKLTSIRSLSSDDLPFFSIIAGLCFSLGLRYAGSGSLEIRNLLGYYLDQLIRICRLPALNYDAKLARTTVRNCQDTIALAAACVMAGTGDILIFRRLRSLHGRTDADTPYGSHLAAHLAIGILFLGGGTYTLSTSNIAVASLLCCLYPLFPNTVLDNNSHLQAFRHFWVLAVEPRCLVVRDADTHRPISLPVLVILQDGTRMAMQAPCLLPPIETVSIVYTNDSTHWPVILDIAGNPKHLEAFKRHQSIFVRRRPVHETDSSIFSTTIQALNQSQTAMQMETSILKSIFALPRFARFDRAEQALILLPNIQGLIRRSLQGTMLDDRLFLETGCITSGASERLWNLRMLFTWAEEMSRKGQGNAWMGKEVVGGLRAMLEVKIKNQKT